MAGETVMVIDSDDATRESAAALLSAADFEVVLFDNADMAMVALAVEAPAAVLFAVDKDGNGQELYQRLHATAPAPKYIVLSEATGVGTAADDLGLVAFRKPLDERTFVQEARGAIAGTLVDVPAGDVQRTDR